MINKPMTREELKTNGYRWVRDFENDNGVQCQIYQKGENFIVYDKISQVIITDF